jgi:H(+)-translocating pyrophosphatase
MNYTVVQPFVAAGSSTVASAIIIGASILGFLFAYASYKKVAAIEVRAISLQEMLQHTPPDNKSSLLNGDEKVEEGEDDFDADAANKTLHLVFKSIQDGAKAFLFAEYKYMFTFIVFFSIFIAVLVGSATNCGPVSAATGMLVPAKGACWTNGILTVFPFILGGTTSILSGWVGMQIAVFANARTSCAAQYGWTDAFNTAFRAGAVMGFCLCSMALIVLYLIIVVYHAFIWPSFSVLGDPLFMFEAIAGYGLGGSSIALFGRVGGGIYTKAADVGADLVGKFENGLDEDDPRNPACIADNVGDNVGDVAGMGADLFGSFAEATCACLVVMASSPDLNYNFATLMYPLLISAGGIVACFFCSFIATNICPVTSAPSVEGVLRVQMIMSTLLTSIAILPLTLYFLPEQFCVNLMPNNLPSNGVFSWVGTAQGEFPSWCLQGAASWMAYICVFAGLWGGLIIGYFTDYMTSNAHGPVQELAKVCDEGAAMNIIFGISLGNFSTVVPAIALAVVIYFSFFLCHMFGVALAALGMLSTLSIGLTIDAYGPVCDNAGGIAEMSGFPGMVRERTDVMDAAGNTTAAIGKGFAIGSAALVSLALFGAFVTRIGASQVNILQPITFAGLLIGSMLPYWFSGMCMRSVGKAANEMVVEVRRQFTEHPGILTSDEEPDSNECIRISTESSLREMVGPGILVMGTPIGMGFFFGVNAVTGLLAGGMVSGVQMAISSSNMGGAWDNAKKYVEAGNFGGKNSRAHKAAVIGDTVGDPLKDTSGPALNILMKLMAIISLVFADFFVTNSLPVLFGTTAF